MLKKLQQETGLEPRDLAERYLKGQKGVTPLDEEGI